MGMSANQARFLSLTSRQVDLEYRMQQICHRRLRLASELEKIATKYNNALSDRKMFASTQTMYEGISLSNLDAIGYKVINNETNKIVNNIGVMNIPAAADPAATEINSQADFLNLMTVINAGGAPATAALSGNYVLNCDINLSNQTFNNSVFQGIFTGTFDGQGHTISGLNINASSEDNVGIFSESNGATIKNIAVDNADITGNNNVGGIVGYNQDSIIDNCSVSGEITGNSNIGGIAGTSSGTSAILTSTISNSHSTATITDTHDLPSGTGSGGIVGYNLEYSTIEQCYATGDVSGKWHLGGITGFNHGTISNSYATGNISGINNEVGGLVGWNRATVENSFSTGTVQGVAGVAGLVGRQEDDATYNGITTGSFWNTQTSGEILGTAGMSTGTFDAIGLTSSEIASNASPINTWDTNIWDLSGNMPMLIGTNDPSATLEEGLRNGTYSLAREANMFTQDPIDIDGTNYEKVDWRTVPTIDNDLYTANDVDAENKYDSAVEKINSQDKKLQMEQSQIEVEHKAITTQKDAVKNILNKNIESSFKTFS